MKSKPRALVVEDDGLVVEFIKRSLVALDHDCQVAHNLADAREILGTDNLSYVILDLKIPALADGLFPEIDYGMTFLDDIQRIKGKGRLPVIVMTSHTGEGFSLAVKLTRMGANACISKPLNDEKKPLTQVVKEVLEDHYKKFPDGADGLPAAQKPDIFSGGVLAYYPTHIELRGETILEAGNSGHGWGVLQALRKLNSTTGKLMRYSGPGLANEIGLGGQVGRRVIAVKSQAAQNTVAQCIKALRQRVAKVMLERQNLKCGTYDVIDNRGGGYRLNDRIIVEGHGNVGGAWTLHGHVHAKSMHEKADVQASKKDVHLTDRQLWSLEQLKKEGKLTRGALEKKFQIGQKQAWRELVGLSKMGIIEFVRKPKPGYYRLKKR